MNARKVPRHFLPSMLDWNLTEWMSDGFLLMSDTPPALLANIMSTMRIIQKKGPCLVISMFLKMPNTPISWIREIQTRKTSAGINQKERFTWAKNIYWETSSNPSKATIQTGPHRPWSLSGTQEPAFYCLAPPCFTDRIKNGSNQWWKRAAAERFIKKPQPDRPQVGLGACSKSKFNRGGGRVPLDGW